MVKQGRCAILFAFLVAFFSFVSETAQAQTILHVNRTDSNCGGQSPCFTTIQAAINAAGPGNIVRIQAGTYPERLQIQKNDFTGATEADRIVIEADPNSPAGSVVITGSAGPQCPDKYAIRIKQTNFLTIRDLTFTGTGSTAIILMGGNNGNQGIHIELNRIFGNGLISSNCDGGIVVGRGNPSTLIVNNLIYGNSRNAIAFDDADGGPHYVINNTIFGNQWNGIYITGNQIVTIANNIINGNGAVSGTTGGRFGVKRETTKTPQPGLIKLLNNLVCGNTQGQISTQVLDSTDSGSFTPLGNEGPGVGALPGCELPANLFGNLNGLDNQPNTADDDFSLKPNSLAIDVGMDPRTLGFNPSYNPIFEADFVIEGIRPADGDADRVPAFDAGAFEFPNAPPVANAGANQTVATGQMVTLNGTQSSDPEGAPLTYEWSVVSQPGGSSLTLSGATTATPSFTPPVAGQYIFQLVVNDGQFASAPSTVVITAVGANQAPTANDASVSTDEDTSVIITLNGSDVDGAGLSFSIVANPANGTLGALSAPNCVANGSGSNCTATVTYTPNANYNGPEGFTFKVNDGGLDSNVATVSITINPVNDAPVANNGTVTTDEDTSILVTLSATDIDSGNLTLSMVTGPSNGALGVIGSPSCTSAPNGTGTPGSICTATLTYMPAANFSGSDSFTFKVNDGSLDSNLATVSIAVNAVNDAPAANDDFYNTDEDTTLSVGAPGVLGNDTDIDTPAASLTAILVAGPSHAASFTLNPDGSFNYTPAANFNGTDSFTYKANDGTSDSTVATVTIAVIAVNDAPVAANDFYNTDEDTALDVPAPGVLANDNDIDTPQANLTAILVAEPSHAASFTLNADGSFSYMPAANFNGTDSFTYKANDGANDGNVAMVTIAVNPLNDAPVAQNDNYVVAEDSVLSIAAPGVLENDTDPDSAQTLTVELVSAPAHALAFVLNADGAFTYTTEADFYGVDTFAYRVFDGTAYSNVAMAQVSVANVNDAPIAQSQSVSTNQNTPVIVTLSASDIDSAALSFNSAMPPSQGSLGIIGAPNCTVQGQGAACTANVSYTPAQNYFGPDSFTFTATDGLATSAPATVSITVIQVNRPPSADAGGPYTGIVGVPVQFNGTGNDPEGDPITFSWDFGDGGTGTGANPTHTYAATGVYTVTLTVTDPFGASGSSQTTATINPALVLNPIGDKTVNLGETLTFTVTATSSTGTPSLFVAPLPLPNHASFNAATGLFTFTPDTTQVGSFQLTFSAVSGNLSASETITIAVPNPPPGGTTAVRGKVENLNDTPLGNVKITLLATGQTAFSGADGFFTLTGIPAGRQVLLVNGREANLGVFAILAVSVDLIEGVLNNLAGHITLPDVDVEAEVQVSSTFTTVVTNPNLPGVELTIAGGTARNSDGTPFTGKLSINPVPDYGRPESRPEELRPGMAVTIQPAGVRFNPPARITFPNADGVPPGNEFNLWSLSPDTGTFNIVGKGVVSADGLSIITVEGGVSASAWHFPLPPGPEPDPDEGDDYCGDCEQDAGSTANLKEGSVFSTHSTPSYRSLGQSRSVSLTYSSVTADPNPVVSLNLTLSVRAAVPNSFSTRLVIGGVQQGGEIYTDARSLPEDEDSTSRLAHMFNAANLPTGRYSYQATVFSNYLNSSIGGITNGNVIVVNRKSSVFGTGWGISDLQQLHVQSSGGVLLTTGNGRARFFSGGPNTFTSPPRDFTTLVRNPDGTFTRTLKDGAKIHFNAQGFQTSLIDRNNNTTSYGYDGDNRLTAITDPVGLVTTLTYASGKLQRITDPAGRQTQFQHDAAGNLIRITSPDGTFMIYAYDGSGRLSQATDERGGVTNYSYDYAGRFSQSVRPGGETRSLTSGRLQGLPNAAAGFGTATNPAPIVRSGNAKATFTDGRGNPTRYTLNGLGQVTAQQDALGQVTTTQYDTSGNPTRITRPNGAVTTMTYDAKGNLLTSTDPVGATTTFTYEASFNQVKTIRDPKGNLTTINYDLKGNPIEIVDALNSRTQMTYDARGLLTSVTSAVGTAVQTTTSFTYDARGNLLTTTNPKGDVTTLAYDGAGNVFRSTDAETRVTEFTFDPRNRLTTVLDADLKTTQYGYDAKGNLTQVRDAKNQITTFAYDARDRLSSATNPLGLTETFAYDGNGNLTSTTNRNGETIAFNYDALNRLLNKTRPPTSSEVGNQATTFNYDSVGNLTAVSNPVANILNQYDAANRLVSSTSTTEQAAAGAVAQINSDTLIDANNRQFEGRAVQVNGRTLTVDGSHTFANLILVNGAVLTHSPTTASSLGKLDITVTGTLQIDATSRIDVTARGFLGGRQPGNPFVGSGSQAGFFFGMTAGFQSGSTGRTGGSYAGLGGTGEVGAPNAVYGDFRNPNDPGSGGAAATGTGGSGGGLLRIIAQTLQLDGIIKADGGNGVIDASGGSGGSIRLDVGILTGAGQITATGGNGIFGGGGGAGRVGVYYQNLSGFNISRITAFGGIGGNGRPHGGAGTVYLQGLGRENGELIIDNNNITVASLSTPILNPASGSISLTHVRARRAARVSLSSILSLTGVLEISSSGEITLLSSDRVVAATINITGNSTLTVTPTTSSVSVKADLGTDNLTVDATSKIDVVGRGFLGGAQPGNPFGVDAMTQGFQRGSTGRTGGSYGGLGGTNSGEGIPGPVYGDFRDPNHSGSGGGTLTNVPQGQGGNGGGLVRVVAQTMVLNGSILTNGANAIFEGSGGSGGGIRIDVGTLSGTGQITASGGNGLFGGGGGGGRIAIYYQSLAGFDLTKVSAVGGIGGNGRPNGGAGTAYVQGPGRENGELIIDNSNRISLNDTTPLFTVPAGSMTFTDLRIRRGAKATAGVLINVGNAVEISTDSRLLASDRILASTVRIITRSSIEVAADITATSLEITDASTLAHPFTTSSGFLRKLIVGAQTVTIDSTSKIDVVGRGFLGGAQLGNPFGVDAMTQGFQRGSTGRAGGSYGGLGGFNSGEGVPNPVYGDFRDPNHSGSGGGTLTNVPQGQGGNGGGLVRVVAQTMVLNGSILTNAANAFLEGSGGSGGGIRIDVGTLSGTGQIMASGGNGLFGGGGGGGRIAIYYQSLVGFDFGRVTVFGGIGANGRPNGQNGTIFTQQQTFIGLAPKEYNEPVMKAEAHIDSTVFDSVRMASLAENPQPDLPQRRIFSYDSALRTQNNLYLAMLSDGKLKPFASTGTASQGAGVSELTPSSPSNPKSAIQNPKLGDFTPDSSLLTAEDLDPIYTYDLNGNRISMIDPTGLTTYTYDALNRLTSITNNKGQVTSFTYDALGRRTSMTHANGVVTSYSYDAASQLLSLVHQLGTTTVNSFNYTYDRVGNRKSKTNRDGAHNYTYDTLNRLVEALNPLPSNPQESYVYDSVGNRTTSNQNGTSSFNQANEQLDDATFTYQYDNNGNMTRKTAKAGGAVTTYEYDAENKLVRVVSPTNTANYRYDGLGRRVEKEVIAGTTVVTRYVYDNEDILLELNGSNAIAARYTHGPGIDEPLIMEKAGASFYYHADGLGSITDITNQSGGVIQRYTYSSFGEIESRFDSNFVQPYTFTAREFDPETGLYHYRARQYDWRTGRFTTIDPLGFDSGSINLYSYVGNNPTNYTDPLGLFQWYGKWGGPGYTGGQNGSWNEIDPSKALPPIDKQDECYRQHDVCYGNCRDGSPCSSIRPPNCPAADQRAGCFKDCDRKLSKCLTALRGDPSNNLSAIIAARLFARTNPASDCAR